MRALLPQLSIILVVCILISGITLPTTAAVPKIDFYISSLTAPSSAEAGQTISVSDTTNKKGGSGAPATTTKFYLSTDSTYNTYDTYLGSRSVPTFWSGKRDSSGITSVTIPCTFPGSYYIIGRADADNAVAEVNEGNNNRATPINVTSLNYTDDLDDNGNVFDNNFTAVSKTTGGDIGDLGNRLYIGNVTDAYFGIKGTLRFDQNEDGDLKDADDYTLYTGLYVIDWYFNVMVRPAYYKTNITDLIGTRQKINGKWYLVTGADPASDDIKMGPAIYKNLAAQSEALKTKATTFVGDAMMLLLNGTTTNSLVIYKGDIQEGAIALNTANEAGGASEAGRPARAHVEGAPQIYGGGFVDARTPTGKITTKVHDTTDALDNYEIFLTKGNETSSSVEVTITDTSQISKIQNKQENVLGYAKAYVGDNDIIWQEDTDALFLMGDMYTIQKGCNHITGTYFNIMFYNDSKVDIRRRVY